MLTALAAVVLAVVPPAPTYDWSMTMLDGSPVGTSMMFADQRLAPGEPLVGGYIIEHTPDINGALDVRVERISAPQDVEEEMSITVGIDGVQGQTTRLSDMLDGDGFARATRALPEGDVRLDLMVNLDAGSLNASQADTVRFRFMVTVSDREFTDANFPTPTPSPSPSPGPSPTPTPSPSPEPPHSPPTVSPAGPDDGGGTDDPDAGITGGLPSTGMQLGELPFVVAGAFLVAGTFLLLGRARRSCSEDSKNSSSSSH